MVPKVDKLVALPTVLPRNLVFWWPQAFFKRSDSAKFRYLIFHLAYLPMSNILVIILCHETTLNNPP